MSLRASFSLTGPLHSAVPNAVIPAQAPETNTVLLHQLSPIIHLHPLKMFTGGGGVSMVFAHCAAA